VCSGLNEGDPLGATVRPTECACSKWFEGPRCEHTTCLALCLAAIVIMVAAQPAYFPSSAALRW